MLLKIKRFLSSDAVSLTVNENFSIDDEEFLKETGLDKDVLLTGEILKIDDGAVFTGKIEYTFTDECARCLKEFGRRIESSFQADIVEKEDTESDEIQLLIADGSIKMDETIKQLIYLTLHMKSLCSKDCICICPSCGVNLNNEQCKCENNLRDPRLEKLKDLLK